MEIKFWIYENWNTSGHRARIHKATCKYCLINGNIPKQSTKGSLWRGPFNTFEEATNYAKQLGAKVSGCRKCTREYD